MDEFREIFSTGVQRRKVAHTGLNDVSSRSHGVLTIAVKNGNTKGKLNLIDLAGNLTRLDLTRTQVTLQTVHNSAKSGGYHTILKLNFKTLQIGVTKQYCRNRCVMDSLSHPQSIHV